MKVSFRVRGVEQIQEKINALPKKFQAAASEEVAIYMVGNEARGLQYYPPQKTVGYKKYMYKRTYNFRFGWKVAKFGDGSKSKIVNGEPYAVFPNTRWAGAPWNWKTIPEIIKKNLPGAMKAVRERIARILREAGFGHRTPV